MTTAFESRGTKPYECDACHEMRDAHESPPTGRGDELICEDCSGAEETVPASRIMRERSHFQAETERLQARVLELVRENEALRISRDTARASSDRHYAQLSAALEQTGISKAEAATARAELRKGFEAHKALTPEERIELEALRARVARMELRQNRDAGTIGDLRDTLEDVLKNDAVGKDCEECGGYGGHGDSRDNWDDCDAECFGGRVPR